MLQRSEWCTPSGASGREKGEPEVAIAPAGGGAPVDREVPGKDQEKQDAGGVHLEDGEGHDKAGVKLYSKLRLIGLKALIVLR